MFAKFIIGSLIIVLIYIALLMFMYKEELKLKEQILECTEAQLEDLRERIKVYFAENENIEENVE